MGSSGGGSTTSTVGRYRPPRWTKKLFPEAAEEAQRLFQGPLGTQFYPDPTYVPYSPTSLQAIGRMEQLAGQPSPLLGAAEQESLRTLRGDYLSEGTNPYLPQLYNLAATQGEARLRSGFGGGNRVGSGAYANALANFHANLGSQLYGQAYEDERRRQVQQTAVAPGVYGAQFMPAQQQLAAGGLREAKSREELADQIARYQFSQMAPYQKLDAYLNQIAASSGPYGAQSSYNVAGQQGGGGGAGGFLGGALTGGSIGASTGSPWGAAGGAILGGLLGAFG